MSGSVAPTTPEPAGDGPGTDDVRCPAAAVRRYTRSMQRGSRPRHRRRPALAASLCAAWLAALPGCGGADAIDRNAEPLTPGAHESMNHPSAANPVPDAVMDRLYADAAADSGMSRDAITLVRAERATWRDAARGCPQPNVSYAQVIVKGYWVILRAGRQEYDYRVGPALDHIRCTGATKQAPIIYPDN